MTQPWLKHGQFLPFGHHEGQEALHENDTYYICRNDLSNQQESFFNQALLCKPHSIPSLHISMRALTHPLTHSPTLIFFLTGSSTKPIQPVHGRGRKVHSPQACCKAQAPPSLMGGPHTVRQHHAVHVSRMVPFLQQETHQPEMHQPQEFIIALI
eukprot:802458-Pelagomonas_calceolata.AAC.1